MLTIILTLALFWVIWKLFIFGLKLTWGIAKLACTILLFPLIIIGLVAVGLIYLAIPILIAAGILLIIGAVLSG